MCVCVCVCVYIYIYICKCMYVRVCALYLVVDERVSEHLQRHIFDAVLVDAGPQHVESRHLSSR